MYGKSGLSTQPTTTAEANGRSANQRLHDKLLAIRNGRRDLGRNRNNVRSGSSGCLFVLTSDVVLNLAFAAEEGKLSPSAKHLFESLTRAEILCLLLRQIATACNDNKELFGYKEKMGWPGYHDHDSREHQLLCNILRLTREEVTEGYGAEDWHSHYRPYDKVHISDVSYGQFLRDYGLGHRYGGNITEDDLPPIDFSALHGSEVFARAQTMRRLVRQPVHGG
jgi:hypothetical protein